VKGAVSDTFNKLAKPTLESTQVGLLAVHATAVDRLNESALAVRQIHTVFRLNCNMGQRTSSLITRFTV
jgi:hypothetical protein